MGNRPTALRKAIRQNDIPRLQSLLAGAGSRASHMINQDHSADCVLDSCSPVVGNALYYAVSKGRLEAVGHLLEAGADVYSTGQAGETGLHCAARYNYVEIGQLLVKHGCDVTTTDDNGRLPIHCAAMTIFNTSRFIEFLLTEAGSRSDVNARDFAGWTPLHEAAFCGNADVVRCLLALGADIHARSNSGKTVLDSAEKHESIRHMLSDN